MFKMLSIRRASVYVCTIGSLLLIADLTGIHRHLFEKDFKTEFSFDLDIPDFQTVVHRFRNREAISRDPINEVASNLIYISKADAGCASETYRLIILVKSAPSNAAKRQVIRETWGFTKRFSDVAIKTVFLLGFEKDLDNEGHEGREGQDKADTSKLDEEIEKEISKYNDIIQGDFHDTEDNSTVKTLMGLRWLIETCPNFRFSLIVNDGIYVSVKNLLKFVRHPTEYPEYWEKQKARDQERLQRLHLTRASRAIRAEHTKRLLLNNLVVDGDQQQKQAQAPVLKKPKPTKIWKNSPIDFDIDMDEDVTLYAGHVFSGPTHRHKIGTKYYFTLEEYRFNQLPPFVSTEAIVLSKPAVFDLYYSSFFVKYLRLDDVFLGICAKKMSLEPFHSDYFQLDPSLIHDPYGNKDFRYLVTANNFDDPEGLKLFWHRQKGLGNA